MLRSLLVTGFALGLAVPAFAQQSCNDQVHAVWAEVEQQPNIADAEKNQVAGVLNNALAQAENGNEGACLETLQQVKVALNIEE